MFIDRRPRWGLTGKGWLTLAVAFTLTTAVFIRYVHTFLALEQPIDADTLVIEGWMPRYAILECADLVRHGHYQHVLTVGGPVTGVASPAADDDTHAYVAAKDLEQAGIPRDAIDMVPTNHVGRDRTYNTAQTLRLWLVQHHIAARGINVVTLGPHARRSRLLFEEALGGDYAVGIIAVRDREYDASHWWRYSEGVKQVISETAAYVYARFLFRRD